jgi:hypothetical protein
MVLADLDNGLDGPGVDVWWGRLRDHRCLLPNVAVCGARTILVHGYGIVLHSVGTHPFVAGRETGPA